MKKIKIEDFEFEVKKQLGLIKIDDISISSRVRQTDGKIKYNIKIPCPIYNDGTLPFLKSNVLFCPVSKNATVYDIEKYNQFIQENNKITFGEAILLCIRLEIINKKVLQRMMNYACEPFLRDGVFLNNEFYFFDWYFLPFISEENLLSELTKDRKIKFINEVIKYLLEKIVR